MVAFGKALDLIKEIHEPRTILRHAIIPNDGARVFVSFKI